MILLKLLCPLQQIVAIPGPASRCIREKVKVDRKCRPWSQNVGMRIRKLAVKTRIYFFYSYIDTEPIPGGLSASLLADSDAA